MMILRKNFFLNILQMEISAVFTCEKPLHDFNPSSSGIKRVKKKINCNLLELTKTTWLSETTKFLLLNN